MCERARKHASVHKCVWRCACVRGMIRALPRVTLLQACDFWFVCLDPPRIGIGLDPPRIGIGLAVGRRVRVRVWRRARARRLCRRVERQVLAVQYRTNGTMYDICVVTYAL